jgi:hypothetical protein
MGQLYIILMVKELDLHLLLTSKYYSNYSIA